MATKFATFLFHCYDMQLCRNRQTIQPFDVLSFFYSRVPNLNNSAFRNISYVSGQTLNQQQLASFAEYFYNTVSTDIKRQALASLFRCFDVDMKRVDMDALSVFEMDTIPNDHYRIHYSDVVQLAFDRSYFIMRVLNEVPSSQILRHSNNTALRDVNLMRFAVRTGALNFVQASARLLENESDSLLKDRGVISSILSDENKWRLFSIYFKDDFDIVMKAVTQNDLALEYASPRLQDDDEIVMRAVARYGNALKYASSRLQDDDEIVMRALQHVTQDVNRSSALRYASPRLQDDDNIVMSAVTHHGTALEFASPRLQDDDEIVMSAVTQEGRALEFASPRLRDDDIIITKAVTQRGAALRYAPRLQDDDVIVTKAITQNGLALRHASPRLQDDDVIVMKAVTQNGLALEFASSRLQDDDEIVMRAVSVLRPALQFKIALKYVSPRLQDDDVIVMKAVTQDGRALEFASSRLQDDDEIVMRAMTQNIFALQFASLRFRDDEEIVKRAMTRNRNVRIAASPRLQLVLPF